MRRILKMLGVVGLIGSAAAGAYYYFFRREQKPQVELYFEDGAMLSLPESAAEASAFSSIAKEILGRNPVGA